MSELKFVPVAVLTDKELVDTLRAWNRDQHATRWPVRSPDCPGWWRDSNSGQWWFARAMRITDATGKSVFDLVLIRPWPQAWMRAQDAPADCWEGPHKKRGESWRLELIKEYRSLRLPLPDDWGDAISLLVTRTDGGDPVTPEQNDEYLVRCLYDEANTNEFVQTGDTVWLDGEEIGHFDLPHYLPKQ